MTLSAAQLKARDGRLTARFMRFVLPEPNSGCWLWTGAVMGNGYAVFNSQHGSLAHRASYVIFRGPIPDGLTLDHKCRVRCCVNPAHLEPVTRGENVRRGTRRDLKTVCKHGHPMTGDNIIWERQNGRPTRRCKACHSQRQAASSRRRLARRRGQ